MSAYAGHSSTAGSVEKIDSEKAARQSTYLSLTSLIILTPTFLLVTADALHLAEFDDPNINEQEAIAGVLG